MNISSQKNRSSKRKGRSDTAGVTDPNACVMPEDPVNDFEWKVSLSRKKEPLRREFRKYVEGNFLKHPLLVIHINVEYAAWENWAIDHNQQLQEKYRKEGKWFNVMLLYRTASVLHGFCEELEYFDDETYWEMLGYVWTEQESSWPNRKLYLILFEWPRPKREKLMDEKEHQEFAKLPDMVNVYRGYMGRRRQSLSWTTDKDKAIWFANRFAVLKDELGPPCLLSGVANKADILGFFTRRNESDAVIDPAKVKQQKKTEL